MIDFSRRCVFVFVSGLFSCGLFVSLSCVLRPWLMSSGWHRVQCFVVGSRRHRTMVLYHSFLWGSGSRKAHAVFLCSADCHRRMHVQMFGFGIDIEKSCMWITHLGTSMEHGLAHQVCDLLQCALCRWGAEQYSVSGTAPYGQRLFWVYVQSPWALVSGSDIFSTVTVAQRYRIMATTVLSAGHCERLWCTSDIAFRCIADLDVCFVYSLTCLFFR